MLSRRRLLKSTAGVASAALLSPTALPAFGEDRPPTVLRAATRAIEVNGRAATVFGLRQPDGTAGLFTQLGSRFRVRLENQCGEPTLVHWHGLKPPYRQDGVPGISGPPIAPGAAADYDFPLAFPGTFWMHSHQGLQEQRLMAAPLIIRDKGGGAAQEIVLMLHDFSFTSPDEILAGLRKAGAASGMAMGGATSMPSGHMNMPMDGMAMNGMTMSHGDPGAGGMAMDLNDVVYDALLANDRTLADPEMVRVEPGGLVLLRIINGSAASNFVVDLGRLRGALVAVDGHPVEPIAGSQFPIAIAQRLDLRIHLPKERAAHPVLAVLEGERKQTGIVLAPAGARVERIAAAATKPAAPLDLALERRLRATAPLRAKSVNRTHRVDLTGSMAPYEWGLNGLAYGHDKPLMVAGGERVEIIMANKTMMSHPMHLHGHFFQVVAIGGTRFAGAVRDTVLVPAMAAVTVAFDADNPGRWAFHCHNLYHMESGMMTTVEYQGI